MDPVDRWARTFDEDAAGYAEGRPGYPQELFDVLVERCGLGPGTAVIEIGPGTGQATIELLARGARVHAIEPGQQLAAFLRERLGQERLTLSVGKFEDVPLEPSSADLVVSATAFHWVDPAVGVPRIVDVLRPGGWVALWWNLFYDATGPDAFSRALEPLFERLGGSESPQVLNARDEEHWTRLLDDAGLESSAAQQLDWEHDHETKDLVALYATFSGTRARPEADRRALLDGVRDVADSQFGGRLRRRYITRLYTARKATTPRRSARP